MTPISLRLGYAPDERALAILLNDAATITRGRGFRAFSKPEGGKRGVLKRKRRAETDALIAAGKTVVPIKAARRKVFLNSIRRAARAA